MYVQLIRRRILNVTFEEGLLIALIGDVLPEKFGNGIAIQDICSDQVMLGISPAHYWFLFRISR